MQSLRGGTPGIAFSVLARGPSASRAWRLSAWEHEVSAGHRSHGKRGVAPAGPLRPDLEIELHAMAPSPNKPAVRATVRRNSRRV